MSVRSAIANFVPIAAKLSPVMLLWTTVASSLTLGSSISMQIPLPGREWVAYRSPTEERIFNNEYDYIVVGGGPAGIVVADRLSESSPNARVLLIDRGHASTWNSGGRDQLWWMKGHNLTRFDVPGLFQFAQPRDYFCDDTEALAGCVLGGGTSINSGLYFYPPDEDWDANFPPDSGWTSKDTATATKKARERLPSTEIPSVDGKEYFAEPYEILGAYLSRKGWVEASPNGQVNSKNKNYGRSTYMTVKGERGGPLGTYLVSALGRENFDILLNTKVSRVARTGNTVYGVEIDGSPAGKGIIYVKGGRKFSRFNNKHHSNGLGKVILSAGAFGSPKILFQSGIGPRDVLEIVRDNQGEKNMITEDEWVSLPVGYNLADHAATHVIFRHPKIVAFNHSGAWDNPDPKDLDLYLQKRSGPLASTNSRISFWMTIDGDDGVSRVVQGNARAGSALGYSHPNNLLATLYLGRGMTSRGRLSLTPTSDLKVTVLKTPYLLTEGDLSAVITATKTLLSDFTNYSNDSSGQLELIVPSSSPEEIEKYIREYPVGRSLSRGGNHWMGSCLMGEVVDWDGKVKGGIEGLFVLDASVFRGITSGNPVGTIVVLAERGVERILELEKRERDGRGE